MTTQTQRCDTKQIETIIRCGNDCCTIFSGEERKWTRGENALLVRQMYASNERYPVICGDQIDKVVLTEFKIQIYLKNQEKPSLIFILNEGIVTCPGDGLSES